MNAKILLVCKNLECKNPASYIFLIQSCLYAKFEKATVSQTQRESVRQRKLQFLTSIQSAFSPSTFLIARFQSMFQPGSIYGLHLQLLHFQLLKSLVDFFQHTFIKVQP